MAKKIILIRHGETDWNRLGRYQGHSDTDLNAKGRAQAKKLARRLKDVDIGAVYTSDRKRAIGSARIIFGDRPLKSEPGLKEICFGIFEGLTYDEIMARYPRLHIKWLADPFGVKIPGGETPSAFKKRVLKAFKKITRRKEDDAVAIVTHGGVINIIAGEMLGALKRRDFVPGHTSLTVIEFIRGKAKAVLLNDTAHLNDGKDNVHSRRRKKRKEQLRPYACR
ncbi:MAG: histidine phosphatase family protein [Candidatus Omnitrophota bacterium]